MNSNILVNGVEIYNIKTKYSETNTFLFFLDNFQFFELIIGKGMGYAIMSLFFQFIMILLVC